MRLYVAPIVIGLLAACSVPPVKQVPVLNPSALPADSNSNIVDLSVIAIKLPYDEGKVRFQFGWLCELGNEIKLPNDSLPVTRRDLYEGFRRALGPLNYRFPKASNSAFQSAPIEGPELILGATVIQREVSLCFPFSGSPTIRFGNTRVAKGSVYLKIMWEAFSIREQKVVFNKTTEGTYKVDESLDDAETIIYTNAFVASLKNFAADQTFRDLVLQKPKPQPDSTTITNIPR